MAEFGGRIGKRLVAMAFALASLASAGAAGSAELRVGATVPEHLRVRVVSHPPVLVITESDVARGYVDADAPAVLEVRSNARGGYVLVVEQQADFVRETVLDPGAAGLTQPGQGGGQMVRTHQLSLRFLLATSATPGLHPWPVMLNIAPL